MFEIEQKYHLDAPEKLELQLLELGMQVAIIENHRDTYYNHPCRDFAETKEALRVRRIDGVSHVTYKGSKLPGAIKARRELEWSLDPGDASGEKMDELLTLLGFRRVAEVIKTRKVFQPPAALQGFTVVIDQVQQLGWFAEIERIANAQQEVDTARDQIASLARQLQLTQDEPRSYLNMLLAAT